MKSLFRPPNNWDEGNQPKKRRTEAENKPSWAVSRSCHGSSNSVLQTENQAGGHVMNNTKDLTKVSRRTPNDEMVWQFARVGSAK